MATLQEQSDAAFRDGEEQQTLQQDQAGREARQDDNGYPFTEFADGDGLDDTPGPEPLADDGKGLQKELSQFEFADDETNPGPQLGDQETPPERQQAERSETTAGADDASQPGQLSKSLIRRAQQYGIQPDKAQETYKSDEALASALLQFDQQLLMQRQQQVHPTQVPQSGTPPQAPYQPPPMQGQIQKPAQQPPPQTAQEAEAQRQAELEAYKIMNPELYDETLLADMQGMSEHTKSLLQRQAQELQALRQTVEQQQTYLSQQAYLQQQEAVRRHVEAFDQTLQNLGEEWSDVFGRGHYTEIDRNSVEAFNRGKVLNTVDQLMQLHRGQGRNVNIEAVLESALLTNFPGRKVSDRSHIATHAPQGRDSRGRYTQKPKGHTSAAAKEPSPKEALYRMWDRIAGAESPGDDMSDGI